VPKGTTDADIEATYDKGVLEVVTHTPAAVEAPKPKTIPVRTEKAAESKKHG
jgi:HSP20 family molecular chaperone IbpA